MERVDIVNLIAVALAMGLAAAIPALLPRLPLPGVVLEIIFGVIIGPQVLGLVHPHVTLNFLANLGVGMLFLMAGFETDPDLLKGRPIRNAVRGWGLTLVIAFGAAAALASAGLAKNWLFTGLTLTTTSIGALLPMLKDAGLLAPPYGPMVMAAGLAGEAGPVILLSLLLAGGRAPVEAAILVTFAIATIAAIVAASRAKDGFIAGVVERTMETSGQLPMRLAICALILLVVLSEFLKIDMALGSFVAGALVRAAFERRHDEAIAARLAGLGSAFMIPIFFVTSGVRLDVVSLFSDPLTLAMVPVYALLMLAARGLPALAFYRSDLAFHERIGLAFHSATQLSLVVAISGIAVKNGLMPGGQGAALVGGGILTMLLFPAAAKSLLRPAAKEKATTPTPTRRRSGELGEATL